MSSLAASIDDGEVGGDERDDRSSRKGGSRRLDRRRAGPRRRDDDRGARRRWNGLRDRCRHRQHARLCAGRRLEVGPAVLGGSLAVLERRLAILLAFLACRRVRVPGSTSATRRGRKPGGGGGERTVLLLLGLVSVPVAEHRSGDTSQRWPGQILERAKEAGRAGWARDLGRRRRLRLGRCVDGDVDGLLVVGT